MAWRPPSIGPDRLFEGIVPRAVLRGFLWDNGLTIVLGLALVVPFLENGFFASTPEELDAAFASTPYNLIMVPLGLTCTAVGGFFAAARAPGARIKNAVAVGVASLFFGLLGLLLPTTGPPLPVWSTLVSVVLIVPAAAAGGAVANRSAA